MTIAISGWLSQKDDKFQEWQHLIDDLRDTGSGLYDFRWESTVPSSILGGLACGAKNAVKSVLGVRSISKNFLRIGGKALGLISVLIGGYQVYNGIAKVFKKSKANAKVAGALLACSLALRDPFKS